MPFLLSATIRERSDRYKAKFPTAAALVDDITFMDDLAAGEENNVCVTHHYYEFVNFKEITPTLGIDWDTKSDTFLMDPRDVIGRYAEGPTTMRQVLQFITKFYDPLCLLTPVSVFLSYCSRTRGAGDWLGTSPCRLLSAHYVTLG